jgi:NAD(P)-dependent dehydrogenase (short-subunit alcohol dehydrogenase family)
VTTASGGPPANLRFCGRTAIVTAAGAGIGEAIAYEWSWGGGRTVVADLDRSSAQRVAEAIRQEGGDAIGLPMDVTQPDAVQSLINAGLVTFGGTIDALFNVAGASLPKRVDEMDDEDWYRVMDLNLTSIYRCSKHVIRLMRRNGGGVIINVASTAGIMAENRCAAYTAAKGGVLLLTRNMAMDYARDNIRVNAICPGSTMTPRIKAWLDRYPGHDGLIETLIPMKRYARPGEIAKPAVFLASDDASYITGATLVVDGGMTAGIRFSIFEDP